MNEKTLKIISLAMLVDSALYGVVLIILQMSHLRYPYQFTPVFYAFLVPAMGALLSVNYVKEIVWQYAKKKGIQTTTQFYQAFFRATLISFALLDGVGIIGVVLFFLTGNLYVSVFLIALSALAKIFQFPTNTYILNKKKEFPFCTHDSSGN